MPARTSTPASRRGEDGPHAFVRLDGGDVGDSFGEQGGEEPGTCPDLEGVGGARGDEPVEGFGRRPGAEAVVLGRDGTEGLAQYGGGLVLLHEVESSETVFSGRRSGARPGKMQAGRVTNDSPGRLGGAIQWCPNAEVAQR